MYSPRSVSTTVIPAASIAWSSADSSETIDFDLMIFFTACFAAISSTSALTSAGVSANSTVAPRAAALRSKQLEPDVEIVERPVANRLAGVARAFEVVELDQRRAPLADELALHLLEVVLQPRVVQLDVRASP